jgi:uncharacterized protein (TIGR03118 family)
MRNRFTLLAAVAAVVLAIVVPAGAASTNAYVVHNLVSDGFVPADHTDANLVNAWGIVHGPATPWWVADNGTDKSTVYTGAGAAFLRPGSSDPLVVGVPTAPTGTVFNGGAGFVVKEGAASGPARFLFATESGRILGWNPGVPAGAFSTRAIVAVDLSREGAVFKGLAIATTADGDRIYATDFHNGRVDVFNSGFQLLHPVGAFVDPNLPAGYGPFGTQNINGTIYVTYAKQDADRHDDVAGDGLGILDAYSPTGQLIRRVASNGALNAPWGLAWAPAGFGEFGGDLLVGNFGNGLIHAYRMVGDGSFQLHGTLRMVGGAPVHIDGLWGLGFGNDGAAGPSGSLFFAAGPDNESHGLFGVITASS